MSPSSLQSVDLSAFTTPGVDLAAFTEAPSEPQPWFPGCGRPSGPGDYERWQQRHYSEKEQARAKRQEAFVGKSQARADEKRRKQAEKDARPATAPRKNFSTQYALEYGRRMGWKLIDREHYDARTKRHHDLELGVDVIFDDGVGRVGIQGAGRYERKKHRERFEERGGVEKAERRGMTVLYLEFEKGNKTPILEETWAKGH